MERVRLWWRRLTTVSAEPGPPRRWLAGLLGASGLLCSLAVWVLLPQQSAAARALQQNSALWDATTLARSAVLVLLSLWIALRPPGRAATAAQRQQGQITILATLFWSGVQILGLLYDGLSGAGALLVAAYLSALTLNAQQIWLARRGHTGLAGALLSAVMLAQALFSLRVPQLLGFVAVYAIAVALAGLLVRWWAGLLVAALYIPLFALGQRLTPELAPFGLPALAAPGLLLVLLAAVVALYARTLQRALDTSAQQTRDLQQAQAALQAQHQQLARQAAELEQARAALQALVAEQQDQIRSAVETIRARSVELVNIQTPLIRVMPGVLVAPMIGTWDVQRGDMFLEEVLRRIAAGRFRVIVLDLTAITGISSEVAAIITSLLQAARLLGCRGVLVGLHPEAAQTLVALDLPFEQVQIAADLAEALTGVLHRAPR